VSNPMRSKTPFTGDPEAYALLDGNGFALLLGMPLDRRAPQAHGRPGVDGALLVVGEHPSEVKRLIPAAQPTSTKVRVETANPEERRRVRHSRCDDCGDVCAIFRRDDHYPGGGGRRGMDGSVQAAQANWA